MKKIDFVTDLANLLSLEAKDIDVVVKHLGFDEIIDLIDAAQNKDKKRAARILGIREDSRELSGISDLLASFEKDTKLRKESRMGSSKDARRYMPNINDKVIVNGERGTVKIPNGPNGTIGVMIDGELTMAKRSEVRPLRESTLGMTTIPSLERMRELAGITTCSEPSQKLPTPAVDVDSECSDEECPLAAIQDAFDTIEKNIGNLKIRDGKIVRDRANRILMRLNESATRRGRRI